MCSMNLDSAGGDLHPTSIFMLRAQKVESGDGRVLDIRPDHITNSNQAATLALLWAIAIKFEVCSTLHRSPLL